MNNPSENPLVSIIVRTKDRPKLLKRALQSIFAQTYRPIEVVLVNDGGCDLDIEEIQEILGDISLNYIRLETNTGRANAGNIGIENAKGDYVGFLDDDDEFYPEHVGILVSFLEQSDYKVAYTDCEIVEYPYATDKEEFVVKDRYVLFSEDFSYMRLLLGNYIPFLCLLFDRRVLTDLRFDTEFNLYEDWDLLIRIAELYPFNHIRKVTVEYSQNLGQQVQQITADGTLFQQAFIKLMGKHIDKITPDVLFLNWSMIIDGRELIKGSDEPKVTIIRLKNLIRDMERVIQEKERVIQEKERVIQEKERVIQEKERAITQKLKEIIDLQTFLANVQDTLGWQILESFRRYRDRLLPLGSKRRYYSDLLIKSIKVIKTQGFKAFYYKTRTKLKGLRNISLSTIKIANICIQKPLLKKPVDIVIPVYNAYDDAKECIKSVFNNTDLNLHRLIILDDKSTDPRVRSYLESLRNEGNNVVVLFNEENIGFAKTANNGMRFSNNDVILLNSDTLVTKGWVEKLKRAVYSGPRVATATPFSNNATICSIPHFCQNNLLPQGFDLDSFADFIAKISLRYYPAIPTSVGFCMYIKRDVLNVVGYFDELAFDKGYGEENDFCMKAMKKGYTHVLDDATYIYHKGGASFTTEVKIVKEQEALNIMDRMHSEYLPIVNKFIYENPLKNLHDYISLRIDLERRKKENVQQVSGNLQVR